MSAVAEIEVPFNIEADKLRVGRDDWWRRLEEVAGIRDQLLQKGQRPLQMPRVDELRRTETELNASPQK